MLMRDWKSDAVIDLADARRRRSGQRAMAVQRHENIEVDFKAAGPDKQPTGNRPRPTISRARGTADFDDSKWETLPSERPSKRDAQPTALFNWYRINLTIPARVHDMELAGATAVFETSIDDYAEIWVDGELSRAPGQSGGSVVKGWNATNRLIINRSVQLDKRFSSRFSGPTAHYRIRRPINLHAGGEAGVLQSGVVPVAITPSEVNVEVLRKDRRSTRSCRRIQRSLNSRKGSSSPKARFGIAKVVSSCSVIRKQHDLQISPRKVGSLRCS